MDFEKRCKDAEAKFSERIGDIRKQLDNRWKQIDKFEASLKTYAETKAGWKKKLSQKEGEVDALKVRSGRQHSSTSTDITFFLVNKVHEQRSCSSTNVSETPYRI